MPIKRRDCRAGQMPSRMAPFGMVSIGHAFCCVFLPAARHHLFTFAKQNAFVRHAQLASPQDNDASMSVVVLLGCWTAGKTSTVKRLQSKYEGRFVFIDSDAAVSQNFGGFLGNIFLAHADDPKRAHEYIDWRERYLLTKLLHVQQPCLLAAGPLLVTR